MPDPSADRFRGRCLQMHGASMGATLRHGETVYLREDEQYHAGDVVAFADLLLGIYRDQSSQGTVHVIPGGPDVGAYIANQSTITGSAANDEFGLAVGE